MDCLNCQSNLVIKYGNFVTKENKKPIQRYRCNACKKTYSDQTGQLTFGEHKPQVTQQVLSLLMSGVSQRRCAGLLHVHPITVARKLCRLGSRAIQLNLAEKSSPDIKVAIFDEMETFEHTKCKPVSIPIAVEEGTRRILAIDAVSMPAKGPLAEISRRKYGKRADDRNSSLKQLLLKVKELAPALERLKSDECPRYPKVVSEVFANPVTHETHKGRRGCVVGQGELKRGGFDPLFSLNHTCAMIRDNIKRLSRRTWATTKRIERLKFFLSIYAWCHNQLLAGAHWGMTMP